MQTKFNRRVKIGIASLLACAMALNSIPITVSAETTTFNGDFDSGGFNVWDGVTYDFSWYKPNETDFTISSAAQLAALSILTNDLSGEEYADFVATLQNVPEEYLALVDTFEGKTITLNTDIDLDGYDWLPISYPFDTPNITSEDYNALGHVPDITPVDATIGCSSTGDMISTRYYELPEAEMRFRDLLYGVNFNGEINKRYLYDWSTATLSDGTPITARYKQVSDTLDDKMNGLNAVTNGLLVYRLPDGNIEHWYTPIGAATTNQELPLEGHPITLSEYNLISDNEVSAIKELKSTDIIASYTYDDISEYADTEGFMGVFDGNNCRIKGLHPDTPWTEDYIERLETYDPIGKGFVGYLGTSGSICNLNIKGSYNKNDIVSYSAFLCAYNYGEISNCYVYGDMEQGLVTSIYPVARDYGPYGTSIYKLSETAGTVLPVGNSGFLTAWNEGTIEGCVTNGSVTQAYRQFGFMTCTNKGTIRNSVNNASFSTKQVETDFITDEWSYSYQGMNNGWYNPLNESVYKETLATVTDFNMYTDSVVTYKQSMPYVYLALPFLEAYPLYASESLPTSFNYEVSTKRDDGQLPSLNYMAANLQGVTESGEAWIPVQYNTEIGESIAANHLYGVYGYTAVGGICAVNDGIISGCTNNGVIIVMNNTSTRITGNLTNSSDTADALSYIRPDNAYGLFSTQSNTINNAAGIAVLNRGTISGCSNKGNVVERMYTDRDKVINNMLPIGQITYTSNGFYANDCIIYGAADMTYNPTGLRWHIEASDPTSQSFYMHQRGNDIDENDICRTVNYNYDANMPYPTVLYAFQQSDSELSDYSVTGEDVFNGTHTYSTIQLTSGISVWNTNNINNSTNEAYAENGIVHFSTGLNGSKAMIAGCKQNGQTVNNLGYYLYNTDVTDSTVTNESGIYGLAYIVKSDGVTVLQDNLSVYNGSGGYYKLYADDNRMKVSNIRLYDNELTGKGISVNAYNVDFNDVYNFQNSENGLSEIENCNVTNFYMYGTAVNGVGKGTIATQMNNINFYGNSAEYAVGVFENGAISDVSINTGNFANDSLGMCTYLIDYKNGILSDVTTFTDIKTRAFECYNVDIDNVLAVGSFEEKSGSAQALNNFMYCDLNNVILELEVPVEWKDPRYNAEQYLPGLIYTETVNGNTNAFTDCFIQCGNGYNIETQANFMYDVPVHKIDGLTLVYDNNAKSTGAFAYILDNGSSDTRTYNYTVAHNDTIDVLSEISQNVEIDKVMFTGIRPLTSYTRTINNSSEKPYYCVDIPYTGYGVGEIKGSVIQDEIEQVTSAANQIFPQTHLYIQKGEKYTIIPEAETGYGLSKLEEIINEKSTELKFVIGEPLTRTMEANDVTIYATWADVYVIDTDDESEFVKITTNVPSSAPNSEINVNVTPIDETTEVNRVWYYNYVVNESNREVLDTENPVEIDLQTMTFVMPANNIKIFASVHTSDVVIGSFILSGVKGDVDNEENVITVKLDNSVDLTNIAPDKFEIVGAAKVEPAIAEKLDFTKDVIYTVTSEAGTTETFTVKVIALEDGYITSFDVLGKTAEINQETGEINISISKDIDLSSVTPKIAWSGSSITPNGIVDLSDLTETYIVTSSEGSTKTYIVTVTIPADETALQEFVIEIPGTSNVIWNIDEDTKTIRVLVPYGTDVSACVVTDYEWYGMATNLKVGDVLNLTKCNYLTIKADNGETQTYSILALEAPSSMKQIHQFSLYGKEGVIDETNKTITVTLPSKYDIRNIAPDVVTFTAKNIEDIYIKRNFTQTVEYVVNAYDGSSVVYTVTVIQE